MRIARNTIRSRDRPLGCTTLVLETHSLSWLSAPSPIVPTTSKRRLPTDLVGQAFYQGVATAAVFLALFGSSTMLLGRIERRRLVALASLMERGLLSYSCLFSIGRLHPKAGKTDSLKIAARRRVSFFARCS
jgi:hypothetical protein